MTDRTLEDVESALDRATDLEGENAVDVLQKARRDLEELQGRADVDEDYRRALETQLEQREREVKERGAYDGGFGSAMNPEDDDAP